MIMKTRCLCFVYFLLLAQIYSQQGKIIRFSSANAMFPDSARLHGHEYNGKKYEAKTHYADSSVLIYVPDYFSDKGKINLVYWFHGWGNNIDSACFQFQLLEQFQSSQRNAIFIFPEGPKNAPDSYGGKLENPEVFQNLTKEVIAKLRENSVIKKNSVFQINDYSISLAGHSGAYRVISKIINKTQISEVILFDALYGGNFDYLQWLSNPENRFINIYTKDGGTFENSQLILSKLTDSLHVPVLSVFEDEINEILLVANRKLFIFSKVGHNEVITHSLNWERFLRYIPKKASVNTRN